jgi:hypothetical protein
MSLKFEMLHKNLLIVPSLDLYVWLLREYENANPNREISVAVKDFGLETLTKKYEDGFTHLKIKNKKKFIFAAMKYDFSIN